MMWYVISSFYTTHIRKTVSINENSLIVEWRVILAYNRGLINYNHLLIYFIRAVTRNARRVHSRGFLWTTLTFHTGVPTDNDVVLVALHDSSAAIKGAHWSLSLHTISLTETFASCSPRHGRCGPALHWQPVCCPEHLPSGFVSKCRVAAAMWATVNDIRRTYQTLVYQPRALPIMRETCLYAPLVSKPCTRC